MEMIGQHHQTIIEVPTQLTDLMGMFGNLFLTPAVRNRPQQGNQGGGGGQNHPLTYPKFDKLRVLLKSCAEKVFAG